MTTRGRYPAALMIGAFCTIGIFASVVSPAVASPGDAPVGPVSWLAAGDSYSSGEGIAQTGTGSDTCAQSPLAYGPRAADILRSQRGWTISPLAFVACTGATTHEFYSGGSGANNGRGPQWTQAVRAEPRTKRFDVVTLSFGGNDIDFPGVIKSCVNTDQVAATWTGLVGAAKPGQSCNVTFDGATSKQSVKARIDALIQGHSYTDPATGFGTSGLPSLADFYAQIATTNLTDRGTLVVVGYPRIFAPSSSWGAWRGGFCNFVSATDADMLGTTAQYLDQALRGAVDLANTKLGAPKIQYVSRYDLFGQDGSHSLCSGQVEYLNGLSVGFWDGSLRLTHSFHPNEIGHQVTAETVAGDVASGLTVPTPAPGATATATPPPTRNGGAATPTPLGDGTTHWGIGDSFNLSCVVAWPTAPLITSKNIQMTMSCPGTPQQFLFVEVIYPDPNLPITPNTGTVRVRGTIADFASSAMGFRELVVAATSVTWPGHGA